MNITRLNPQFIPQNPLLPQPVGSQAVRRIERSNITPMDLAKFLQNRKVMEVQEIATKLCTAADPDPGFRIKALREQLRVSGFANFDKSSCRGGEKYQLITGLLQHLQKEFLNLGEGVEGPEATKFCKLIREPNSCLSMGIDCLIDEINVHKREQEAGEHGLPGMSAGLPSSEGFPSGDGGTTGQAMNPDVFQQLPREQQALHYPPENPAPSAPPAYDDAMAGSRASELAEQQRCNKGLDLFTRQLGHYSLDPSGTGTAMNNMAQILTRMSGQCTQPKTTTVASGERLTSLAEQVRMTSVNVFRNDSVSTADIGVSVVGNNQDIQPVVNVSWVTLDKFPVEVQERLQLAGIGDHGKKDDTNIPIVQVYLCASSEKALEGAEFTVDLHSTIRARYLSKFSPRGMDKLIPLSVALRMPKGLHQGADFHHAGFALHEVSLFGGERPSSSRALFSHGQGRNDSERHNIGIQQVAPILEAMGVDRKTAMSREAGLAIPFGFTLLKQSEDALVREAKVSKNMLGSREMFDFGSLFGGANSRGGTYRGGTFRGGNFRGGESAEVPCYDEFDYPPATGRTTRGFSVQTDGVEPEANEPITSGINPLACTTERKYTFVNDGAPTEAFAWVGGLIWVQTVTSLPGIETSEDLKQWVDKQKVDPLNPVLPGIL